MTATWRIRQIEALLSQPATPIIAMTALAMQGDHERCQEAGMDDYMPKPLKSKAILDMLLKYCGKCLEQNAEDNEFDAHVMDISFLKRELEYFRDALRETDWKTACNSLDK